MAFIPSRPIPPSQTPSYMRVNVQYEPEPFPDAGLDGWQHYSGADVRVYFGHILLAEVDSIGYQLAQNARPIYPYNSSVFSEIQYGSRLVQGYINLHLSDAAYIPAILAAIELKARRGGLGLFEQHHIAEPTPERLPEIALGSTVDDALSTLAGKDWNQVADAYDLRAFGYRPKDDPTKTTDQERFGGLTVNGIFPMKAGRNDFVYAPQFSSLRLQGFKITLVFGTPDASLQRYQDALSELKSQYVAKTLTGTAFAKELDALNTQAPGQQGWEAHGTIRQIHGVRLVSGPNVQIKNDGSPLGELYTYLAKDLT